MIRIKHIVPVLGIVMFLGATVSVEAATLTSSQVASIVNLLQSFGADSQTIANVQSALGSNQTQSSPSQTGCACPMLASGSSASCNCSGSTTVTPVNTPPPTACSSISSYMGVGATGTDVSTLQQALGVSVTGYFGSLTKAALMQWQSAHSISATGYVGPQTRAAFNGWCDQGGGTSVGGSGDTTTSSTDFSANPTSGTAPLSVYFRYNNVSSQNDNYSIDFGDGTSGTLTYVIPPCAGSASNCSDYAGISHTYASNGTYTATLSRGTCPCPSSGICNCPNMHNLGTVTITVGTTNVSTNIQKINAPGSVTLQPNYITEVRNENVYFTLQNVTSSSAMIQVTPVGCWNSFPSDPPRGMVCMLTC